METEQEKKRTAIENFPPDSRIWIYQSDRTLSKEEVSKIREALNAFCIQWTAHNQQLHAAGEIYFDRFLVLGVDKNIAEASGCSIDKSVHFMKQIEDEFKIHLFNRLDVAYIHNDEIKTFPISEVNQLLQEKTISNSTIIFNNAVSSKKEMDENWKIKLGDSWLKNKINASIPQS